MYYSTLSLLLLAIGVNCQSTDPTVCADPVIQTLCIDQETCDQCLQTHPCCNYCYDQNYDGRKCNTLENLSACSKKKQEVNTDSKVEVPKEQLKDFSDENPEQVIQLKPQFFNINLAKDTPQNFTFTYKPAKNYPLDLYYLGDMSATMRKYLSVFKTIGADLPTNLTVLTKNYKLAFGSFLDKVAMPFYPMAPDHFKNPCVTFSDIPCDVGYLFRHTLSFTNNIQKFIEEVSNSKTTANLDDLDGALDAILQILVCEEKIGWAKHSRKIILLPTDSLLHSAGDGILAGAVLKPNSTCLLNDEGHHISPLTYDYPSIGQIHSLLKEKKVNIIFAVKDKRKLEYYRSLTKEILKSSGFVGELQEDAKNILELINKGFYNFARQVSFYINTTFHENLDVKFFGDCEHLGILNETSTCYDIADKPVNFTVQLTLKGPPIKSNDVLFIEENNIYEKITLNISYIGLCSCGNYDGEKLPCVNGDFKCGTCICHEEWTGKFCNESCDVTSLTSCRPSIDGYICNRNGECVCGRCLCNFPFEGQFCQYQCPVSKTGEICSGPSHGKCIEGECECTAEFKEEDCSCSKFSTKCKLFDEMNICSGNGECVCNHCRCNIGFSGQFCEFNKENNTLCDEYIPIIEKAIQNGSDTAIHGTTKILIQEVDTAKRESICNGTECEMVVYEGTRRCTSKCCYHREGTEVHWLKTTECVMTAGFTAITGGVAALIAVILVGLLTIACAKYRIYKIEKEEYRRFQEESGRLVEMNPIYRDPISVYRNPLRARDD